MAFLIGLAVVIPFYQAFKFNLAVDIKRVLKGP